MPIADEPVRQAFGSPGGKTELAKKIIPLMPDHDIYVEPFAGGAAVYFRKEPVKQEVLNDKDTEIAFAFKFLKNMTPEQFERLKRYDWTIRRSLFDKLKASTPKDDVERFRKFYYLKKGSFAMKGDSLHTGGVGKTIGVDHLFRVGDRLNRTTIFTGDAQRLIKKYDGPHTLFYLDPPYPGRGHTGNGTPVYTEADFKGLLAELQGIKGKCIVSVGTEHAKLMPRSWDVKRLWCKRHMALSSTKEKVPGQYEIVAANYDLDKAKKAQEIMVRRQKELGTDRGADTSVRLRHKKERVLHQAVSRMK